MLIIKKILKFRIFIPIVILSVHLLLSCGEDSEIVKSPKPLIIGLSKEVSFHGDIIKIYGKNFGKISDNSSVEFYNPDFPLDTVKWIASKDCIKWTESEITFEVLDKLVSSEVYVCVGGVITEKIYLKINPLPEFEMIEIPSDTFMMGSDTGLANEKPMHKVEISYSLFVSKYEVNQLLWRLSTKTDPSITKGNDLPVHNIEWIDAVKFCNKISKKMNFDTCYNIVNDSTVEFIINADGYRLPTEAEWEYACKAGESGDYSGAKTPEEVAWFNSNSGFIPHIPGLKKGNKFGLFDMQGNVWEWCWDYYSDNYYAISPEKDPLGPESGKKRVLRGGSSSAGKSFIRSSNRTYSEADYKFCGLRIVRTKF